MRLCDRCETEAALKGERFCKVCRKAVLRELQDARYLQAAPGGGRPRGDDARENVRETKHGTGH